MYDKRRSNDKGEEWQVMRGRDLMAERLDQRGIAVEAMRRRNGCSCQCQQQNVQ